MFEKFLFRSVVALVAVAPLVAPASAETITHGSTTVNMDFVTVRHPDNDPDDEVMTDGTTGYGRVEYAYRIGKYEVTENQWDAVVAADTNDLLNDAGEWDDGHQPVTSISWYEAAMFCNWLTSGDVSQGAYAINGSGEVTGIDRNSAVRTFGTTYVIPTEDEWYKAAYYDGGASEYYDYPTGSDTVPDGINVAGDTVFEAVFYDGHNQGQPNDVDNAGVLSPYGTMGQGGNVWEWNETAIGSSRGLRGGYWRYGSADFLHASNRNFYNPTNESYNVGFRVASIPEPASITLLVCGLVAGLIWWRRRK